MSTSKFFSGHDKDNISSINLSLMPAALPTRTLAIACCQPRHHHNSHTPIHPNAPL